MEVDRKMGGAKKDNFRAKNLSTSFLGVMQ